MPPATSESVLRVFLPCYFVLYILVGYVYAAMSVRKKYAVDPLAVGSSHPLMVMGETLRNAIVAVVLAMVTAYAVRPSVLSYIGPISFMDRPLVRLSGVGLLVGSFVLLRLAQRDLKGSWRVGFDAGEDPPDLVTTGLYARSRNPIHVAMAATAIGLLLVLPNAVSLTIAALTVFLLAVRVHVEEEYLSNAHGEAYEAYRRRTPRWF